MSRPAPIPMPRAARWPVTVLIAALGIAVAGAGLMPPPPDHTGSYLDSGTPDSGIPAGTVTVRTHDAQAPDRSSAGARRTEPFGGRAARAAIHRPDPRRAAGPEGASSRALERAGRMSAPGTAPPALL